MSEIHSIQGNVNVDVNADATPLVQVTADVVSSSNKGVGKLLNALFGKWIAKNERSIALIQAQTEKDCTDIRNGIKVYKKDELLDCTKPVTVEDAYDALYTLNHLSDARRLQETMEETMRQISSIPSDEISDEPIPQTFFNRWRRDAEMIDEDWLRQWWARVLVEETKKPNSVSLRTLEVVRNISREEAELFSKMVKGEIGKVIPVNEKGHPLFISYSEALKLQSAGLIIAQMSKITIRGSYNIDKNKKGVCFLQKREGLVLCVDKEEIVVDCFILSEVGKCLLPLAQERRMLKDFIEIALSLCQSNDLVFSLHKIIENNGDGVSWDCLPLWSNRQEERGANNSDSRFQNE